MNKEEFKKVINVLDDSNRLDIFLAIFRNNGICACELEKFACCKQATISHHMKKLCLSGLVIKKEEAKWVHYYINYDMIRPFLNIIEEISRE